jgi:hypothetical protein
MTSGPTFAGYRGIAKPVSSLVDVPQIVALRGQDCPFRVPSATVNRASTANERGSKLPVDDARRGNVLLRLH